MTTPVANPIAAARTPTAPETVVKVSGLRMRYGSMEAVRGLDLEVGRGEIFAFLGPNGAGKTTTVEILEGYRSRTGGEVEVLGTDPERGGTEWRGRVGVVLQDSVPEFELTVAETLAMYAGYFDAPLAVEQVLRLVGLQGQASVRNERLSGGQRRRLDFGLALVGDPELIFLDEPTTGFDPAARRIAWEVIAGLRDLGKTIFLTTHYLEEAETLADRIAVIVDGRIVAEGTPATLADRDQQPTEIDVRVRALRGRAALPDGLAARATFDGPHLTLQSTDPVRDLHALCGWMLEQRLRVESLSVRQPTLEDTYLRLTSGASE